MNNMMRYRLNGSMVFASSVALLLGMMLALPATAVSVCHKGEGGKFPASGQTTAYTSNKETDVDLNPVAVPDDGTVQAGVTLDYKDNGDGTITDGNTSLVWEKKSDDDDFLHDKDNLYAWSSESDAAIWDWLDMVNTEGGTGFAGHYDWRIPNVKELQTIIDYEESGPAVASAFDNNCVVGSDVLTGSCTAASGYWSSTTVAGFPLTAWGINFNFGNVGSANKDVGSRVRAVRGGCE